MEHTPLISIIIPAYNAARFFRETLDSALKQTYNLLEVIVVDDGSTDETATIARTYAVKHPNLRLITQKNRGQSAARKAGFEAAQGEYVSFLDADNLLAPDACEIVATHFQSGCDVYYGDIRYFEIGDPKKLYTFSLHYVPEVTLERLIERNFINFLGTFIRRATLISSFDETFRRADDHIIWLKLALQNRTFSYIDRVFGYLRFHTANLSFQKTYLIETAETNLKIFDWLEEEVRKRYSSPRREELLALVAAGKKSWIRKGIIGGLIADDRSRAIAFLERLRSSNPGIYYILRIPVLIAPLRLISPFLMYLRRRAVMHKYSPA